MKTILHLTNPSMEFISRLAFSCTHQKKFEMTISTHTALGEIVKVDKMDKGYTKLVLLVNKPYKTQYLTFSLWDTKRDQIWAWLYHRHWWAVGHGS